MPASMHTTGFPIAGIEFLNKLKRNNNRPWFNKNKQLFLDTKKSVEGFAGSVLHNLNLHDVIETASGSESLMKIYRDVRFSKSKIPYKNHWSGRFRRAGKQRRGGYYYHIEPGNTFIAGGFWSPAPADMKRIRDEFAFDATPFRKVLSQRSFVTWFGSLQGEQLATAPRGFNEKNEAIDLLRFKQFLLLHRFSDEAVNDKSFSNAVDQAFRAMRPFLDYMSTVLTTDSNGESLL